MSEATDNLELERLYWDGCTFWYSEADNKFEVYENLSSLYSFRIRMAGAVWMAEAISYGSLAPVGILNWLADFRGRSLIELLSLVVIVYKDKTDALVFTDAKCPVSQKIIQRAAELRKSPPEWTKKFERFEPNISSDSLE
jgi:hypothetical protein